MKEAKNIVGAIESAQNIVITSHRSPDGDSMGSSLALLRFIKALGFDAVVCHPDPCPNFIEWIKRGDKILDFETDETKVIECINNAELLFSLDYNALSRLGNGMGEVFDQASGQKIMIDHHLNPEDFADISVSEPTSCSTAQLIFELIDSSNNLHLISSLVAEPIYLGIMTDTGSFRFNSVTPRTHEIVAKLLNTGLDHSKVHEETFDGNRIDKLKLRGYAIAEKLEIVSERKVAILSLTMEELERFNFVKGDTEGLVNVALSVRGVESAVFLKETNSAVKMSFRSKGAPVNGIASDHFDGGGHKYAAGGVSYLEMDETIEKLKSVLINYF